MIDHLRKFFRPVAQQSGFRWAQAERSFQHRVYPWLLMTFGEKIAHDKTERNHRFIEEALELVQALGMGRMEIEAILEYVYWRPLGEIHQEVGGVMITLAALCEANGIDMVREGEDELARVWNNIEKIREKQKLKPVSLQ